MADSTSLSYLGAFSGAIGSVLGFVGYRQSGQMKVVELRLVVDNDVRP
jgi:hypothetical protein